MSFGTPRSGSDQMKKRISLIGSGSVSTPRRGSPPTKPGTGTTAPTTSTTSVRATRRVIATSASEMWGNSDEDGDGDEYGGSGGSEGGGEGGGGSGEGVGRGEVAAAAAPAPRTRGRLRHHQSTGTPLLIATRLHSRGRQAQGRVRHRHASAVLETHKVLVLVRVRPMNKTERKESKRDPEGNGECISVATVEGGTRVTLRDTYVAPRGVKEKDKTEDPGEGVCVGGGYA